jgi:hypothetical protein
MPITPKRGSFLHADSQALTRLLNAKATDKPTATTMTSPRIKKFLKRFSIAISPN